jgi:hypothetical protein
MKKYRFNLKPGDVEAMWEFAKHNQVNFHYCLKTEGITSIAYYTYEGFMDAETYLTFRITVPSYEYKA